MHVTTVTGGVIGPHYASSKSAMHGLVHWLSLRYAKDGIVSRTKHQLGTGCYSPNIGYSAATLLLQL